MFKKTCQMVGLILVISFSFYYTDKVATVVRNQDPLMIKIRQYESSFNKESINAFINNENIIPGINACVVDINTSYNNMKRTGIYNSNLIEYKEIKPELSIEKIYNKYIIKGNKDKLEVALVFKLNNLDYIDDLLNVLSKKGIKASFFIDGKILEKDSKPIYKLVNNNHEIYNMGYDGVYNKELLIWTNNIIENISYNKSSYCLTTSENPKILDLCTSNKMYTIKSDIVINYSNSFNNVKNIIDKGSIIVFEVNDKTIIELNKTLLFLNSKGFKYNPLSIHLSEKGCNTKLD